MSEPFTSYAYAILALGVLGFAVQRVLDIADPFVERWSGVAGDPVKKRAWMAGLGLLFGVAVALMSGFDISSLLAGAGSPAGSSNRWGGLLTGLFLSAGSEGMNSLVKILAAMKEGRQADAEAKKLAVPLFAELLIHPGQVKSGQQATAVITLSRPAEAAQVAVLQSTDTAIATVPNTVTIPVGARAITFAITTVAAATGKSVAILARIDDQMRLASIQVTP